MRAVVATVTGAMLLIFKATSAAQSSRPPCDASSARAYAVGVRGNLLDLRRELLLPSFRLDTASVASFVCLPAVLDSLLGRLDSLGITPHPQADDGAGPAPAARVARLDGVFCSLKGCSFAFSMSASGARYTLTTSPGYQRANDGFYLVDDIEEGISDLAAPDFGDPACSHDRQRMEIVFAALAFRAAFTGHAPVVDSASVHLAASDTRCVPHLLGAIRSSRLARGFSRDKALRDLDRLWMLQGVACTPQGICVVEASVVVRGSGLCEFFEVDFDSRRRRWRVRSFRVTCQHTVD